MSYNKMNAEDFKVALSDFMKMEARDESRQFFVYTGEGGMRLFNDAMVFEARVKPARTLCNKLFTEGKITYDQRKALRAMIDSPDRENLTLAESVMEQLSNE